MLMKIIFVLIDCAAVLGLYFTHKAVGRNIKEEYGIWLRKTLFAGIIAMFANILIAYSFDYAFASISFSIYFASIDWILYYLVGFLLAYTEHDKALKIMYRPAAVVFGLDSLSLLTNRIFGHAFYVFSKKNYGDVHFYQTRGLMPFYIHLAIDYTAIAIALFFIIYRLIKTYSIYRIKYVIILSVLMLVILLNLLYMMLELPLDASVIFYAVAGMLIYFSIHSFVPRSLKISSLERAINDMKEGLVLFDISDNCIYANDFSKQRFDIDESTYTPKCEPAATIITNLSVKGEEFGESNYSRTVAKDSDEVREHYVIKYNRLNDGKGRMIGSYLLIEDNTDQVRYLDEIKKARDIANEANNAKSSFLANMSHEIRTPLNSVLGMNEMIMRSTEDKQLLEYAGNIKSSGDALLSLINDILDFSKIEANRMEIAPVDYDPHQLLRDCCNNFEQMAEIKDLYIKVECDETIPSRLYGDDKLIRQILANVVSNAIKYTREGGVTVRVSDDGFAEDVRDLVIEVSDTGIGIAADDIKYLFDAFKRINEKQNATIQGTGLGLAITKELVTLMHGSISVSSKEGQGSTFTIVIPQKVVEAKPIGEFKRHVEGSAKKYTESFKAPDACILVVDDARLNLKVAQALLKNTEIQVETAGGGNEAIEKCRGKKYDCILLDHRMPEPDGIQTFEIITKEGMNTDTPVIMLTANVISGAEEEYIKLGFAGYLSKPIRGEDLEAALIRYLPEEKVKAQ
ncbi:MAG: response regulator [Lachnospiraceae bacterium]|nr:response regulator [Lachnospiraceae bacterium]